MATTTPENASDLYKSQITEIALPSPVNKTAAKALPVINNQKIYPQGSDGGVFIGGTGKAAGYYDDDSVLAYGTKFKPTGGDGSAGWERDYSGPMHSDWFLVNLVGVETSDAAQELITAAANASVAGVNNGGGGRGLAPTVEFGPGRVRTNKELVTASSYQFITGQNTMFEKDPAGFTGTYCFNSTSSSGWRQVFKNLQMQDYDGAIHCDANNTNSGNVIIDECKFFNIEEDAINLETRSGSTIIQNCLWRSCKHEINNIDGDYVVVRGGWIQRGNDKLTVDGDGGIINRGFMKIVDVEGIPEPFTISEPCWIANYGWLVIDNFRFGGEPGQCAAVNNFVVGDSLSPYIPYNVSIKNSQCFVGSDPVIRLFEIPNSIVLDGNMGLTGTGAVWVDWSSTLNVAAQDVKIAAIGSGGLSIERNLWVIEIFGCVPDATGINVPDNLKFMLRDYSRWHSKDTVGGVYEYWNTRTTIAPGDFYGLTNYVGRDVSGSASGTRVQTRVEATTTAGGAKHVIATTNSSDTVLLDRQVIDGTSISQPDPVNGGSITAITNNANANITATTSVTISVAIPAECRVLGVQLRVDTALTAGDTWDAELNDGVNLETLATNAAVAKNTKIQKISTIITDATTNIVVTKNGGGSFTAAGNISATVYYETLTAQDDAP